MLGSNVDETMRRSREQVASSDAFDAVASSDRSAIIIDAKRRNFGGHGVFENNAGKQW